MLLLLFAALPATAVNAQNYRFTLPQYEVEAYLEADGSLTLYYYMVFQNDASASPIDFVDLALPYGDYSLKNIEATIDGQPMPEVNNSAYVNGAELALGDLEIQPGAQGVVTAWVRGITDILYPYDGGDLENYVNFQFTPNFFDSSFERSKNTEYRMTIILPPGVGTDDGRYYTPVGWDGEEISEASTTSDGRVYYSWYTNNADVHSEYEFGAAFPATVIPEAAISSAENYQENSNNGSGSAVGGIGQIFSFLGCMGLVLAVIGISIATNKKAKQQQTTRKLQYLPPKLSVDGKGIRRGLTAVEAGILLEEPLDKILSMILFGLLKKEAVKVTKEDPLEIETREPLPEGLYEYETDFLKAFETTAKRDRRRNLQAMLVELVNTVQEKMKGFSPDETKAYYTDIIRRAWLAVEGAKTPEIKSAQFDHTLEWTMLDDDFNGRTENTFHNQNVYIPRWWYLYRPSYVAPTYAAPSASVGGGVSSTPSSAASGSSSKPSITLPHLPGSDFAANIINGATAVSAGVVGDLTGFTSAVTNRTNPIPVTRPSSGSSGFRGGGGGGSSCACACACAGCACACAGGGR
jgi:hypothetical protein